MSVNVVTIGGGGGHSAVVKALKDLPIQLTALCNTTDVGGGSGKLVQEYGVHSPGDMRRLVATLGGEKSHDFNYRFVGGTLSGQTMGNVVLSALELTSGSFQSAVDLLRSWFGIEQHLGSITENTPTLHGRSASGKEIANQAELVHFVRSQGDPIETLWLTPQETCLSPLAREALTHADYILIPMGDLYSSIAPAFCIPELKQVWPTLKAKVIWLPNVAITPGHVHYRTLSSALIFLQSLLPEFLPHVVLIHDQALPVAVQASLQQKAYTLSVNDLESNKTITLLREDLLDTEYVPQTIEGDVVERSPLKYDTQKLKNIFEKILV